MYTKYIPKFKKCKLENFLYTIEGEKLFLYINKVFFIDVSWLRNINKNLMLELLIYFGGRDGKGREGKWKEITAHCG